MQKNRNQTFKILRILEDWKGKRWKCWTKSLKLLVSLKFKKILKQWN